MCASQRSSKYIFYGFWFELNGAWNHDLPTTQGKHANQDTTDVVLIVTQTIIHWTNGGCYQDKLFTLSICRGIKTVSYSNQNTVKPALKCHLYITNHCLYRAASYFSLMNSAYNFSLHIRGNCSYKEDFQGPLSALYIEAWLYVHPT